MSDKHKKPQGHQNPDDHHKPSKEESTKRHVYVEPGVKIDSVEDFRNKYDASQKEASCHNKKVLFWTIVSAVLAFQPMPLSRRALPFDHPQWIFELKYDGFRALADIENGRTQLISRNGNPFNSFSALSKSLTHSAGKTVLDGEIVCLDKRGKPQFRDLLFHRGEPLFFCLRSLDVRRERFADGEINRPQA